MLDMSVMVGNMAVTVGDIVVTVGDRVVTVGLISMILSCDEQPCILPVSSSLAINRSLDPDP